MGRVFVYEGYLARGGTYMAYQLGLILHRHFDLPVYVVGTPLLVAPQFEYPVAFPALSQDEFRTICTAEDWLICNPSFSDNMFGLTLPCRKLMYVQGVNSFRYLDGFFDYYVFVSSFVQSFVESLYALSGPVLPAFVDVPAPSALSPLSRRADRTLVVEWKTPEPVRQRFLDEFRAVAPESTTEIHVVPPVPQRTLAAQMRASRYFVSLSVYEGFGLPMLEAMAHGCAVVGLANGGNSDFARSGENCRLVRYPRLDELARELAHLLADDAVSERLAAAGRITAEFFSYQQFETRWVDFFGRIM